MHHCVTVSLFLFTVAGAGIQTPGSLDLTTSPRRSVLISDHATSETSSVKPSISSDHYARPPTSAESSVELVDQSQSQRSDTGNTPMDYTPEQGTSGESSMVAMDMTPGRSGLQSQQSSNSSATEYSITDDSPVRPGPRSNSVQSSTTGNSGLLSVGPSLGSSDNTGYSQSTGYSQPGGLSQSLPESDSSLLDNTRNEARSLDLSTSGSSEATSSLDTAGSLDLTKMPTASGSQVQATSAVRPPRAMLPAQAPSPRLPPVSAIGETSEQPSTSGIEFSSVRRYLQPDVETSESSDAEISEQMTSSSRIVTSAPPPYMPSVTTASIDSSSEQPSVLTGRVSLEPSRSSGSLGQPDANTAIVDMDLVGANENVANTVVIETSQGPSGSNRYVLC